MGEEKMVHSAVVTYASVVSLLTLCPPFVILLWYTMVHADGSVSQTWDYLMQHGLQGFINIWPKPTAVAWKIIAYYAAFEAFLQLFLPGKRVEGPNSPAGNRPVYKANGVAAYAVTLITYFSLWWFGIFNPAIVYDHLGEIFSALIFGSFIFCIFLYIKGHLAPSSTDSGSSGNIIIDFYWGMELYPRIGKHFDIKVFTNCRFGMMSWAVLAVTYCIKQYEENGRVADSMLVNTTLMLVYVTKFFWWEAGYWNTMDIAHDRAGFYICWGCLVWVPSVYTSPGMYLVNHPVNLGFQALYAYMSTMIVIGKDKNSAEQMPSAWFGGKLHQRMVSFSLAGALSLKFETGIKKNIQSQFTRPGRSCLPYLYSALVVHAGRLRPPFSVFQSGGLIGLILIQLDESLWRYLHPRVAEQERLGSSGSDMEYSYANYITRCGLKQWGLSRHFHYVPEISAAFFWTLPALFNHFLPYFYVVFLTILLFDRAKRDDDRCQSKYGKYWKLYCEKVPYRIIPGIY
ncbi:hypothetical protein HHK36_026132 [Tetracentron sinense]|uniref:7-dehydrocholesterol reductase n=1 Tax=Tetracentron sinense TaxID=13715 RepID=A0A834YNV6_TETSI|nr:hypothetical protein HHK36_026132 [Tetracentron sinense]